VGTRNGVCLMNQKHPSTRETMFDPGVVYFEQGRLKEAEELQEITGGLLGAGAS
jgi:hypothetical protein